MQRETVELAIKGDHDAFSELARASVDRQYAIATAILRDADRARDAVQDALVSAWRGIGALRDPDAWSAWLQRLTVHACYRVAKSERRRSIVELHVVPDPFPDTADDLELTLAERDRMERAIQRLTLDQRAVIVLHFYADLTLTQVADVLDVPVGTAKSRLHYGLRAMREALEATGERPESSNGERIA